MRESDPCLGGPPNILLVIADDISAYQLGCYGSGFYETPHLDQLANDGVRFAHSYSTSPVCSPARASLYTGQHPARLHLTNYIPGTEPANPRLLTPSWNRGLPVEIDTLGDVFKRAGYTTAQMGKWHLATDYNYQPGRATDPESQGFDEVLVTRKPSEFADPEADPHHIEQLTDEALRFIRKPHGKPFLCVLAHNALHRPELAPAALVEKYAAKPGSELDHQRPVLAAMVEQMDNAVGRLLVGLSEAGLERNTLVVFTADHGAFGRSADLKPLRGAKADLYEGGLRVPLICSQPGVVAPAVCETPVYGADVFSTLLDYAGIALPTPLDGESLVPLLREDGGTPCLHDQLCWHFPHYHHLGVAPSGAIRVGAHKLIEWYDRTIGDMTDGPACELYDLERDPSEQTNLADREPEICADLLNRLREWRISVGAQEMVRNPDFNPALGGSEAGPPPGDLGNPYIDS